MTQLANQSGSMTRPARQAVKHSLLRQIGKTYHAGDRLPSVRELSRILDVAQNTAHEAVRELALEGHVELRPRSGAFVARTAGQNHKPSAAVQGRVDLSKIKVMAYFHLRDQFIIDMYEGFEARAKTLGLSIHASLNPPLVVDVPADVDAMVIFNADPRGAIHSRPDQFVVTVSSCEELPVIDTPRVDIVSVDQLLSGEVAGRALRDAGCQEAFFVGVADSDSRNERTMLRATCANRLAGFERAFGQPIAPQHRSYQRAYGVPQGAEAAEDYLKLTHRPQGVFCGTDELAAGFIRKLSQKGVTAGRDCHVIGFDGQKRGPILLGHPITTVQVPCHEIGQKAADMIAQRAVDPDQTSRRLLLGCKLLPGPTVGKVSRSSVAAATAANVAPSPVTIKTDSFHTSHLTRNAVS